MGVNTKENGKMVKLVVREGFGMPMETLMKASGYRIKLMVMVCTCMQMGPSTLGTGKMMCSMVEARKPGQTGQDSKETT
jgi:hypothetical protein